MSRREGASSTGTGGDVWDPIQYHRFQDERQRPFRDLLALVERAPSATPSGPRVVDLGCGTGELTLALHERLGARETLGLDSSPRMLERAQAVASSTGERAPGLSFREGDIARFDEPGWDVVFSNAALHWVDDHPALFARLAALVSDGGQLAVQVPANHDHPSHTVVEALAQEAPYRDALGGWVRRSPVLPPRDYATLLDELGFARQHVRLQVYGHRLGATRDIVEWTRGTLLTEYEKRLSPLLFAELVAEYERRLVESLGDSRPCFFPFARILLWAARR